jgi:GDPmannose 4,6-dehydratase
MLQAETPDTFVLATQRTESVRDFVRMAFKAIGVRLVFSGAAEYEYATVTEIAADAPISANSVIKLGADVMRVNSKFYRPAEVELLIGNPEKAKQVLGWAPQTTLEQLCEMMVQADLRRNQIGFSF